MNQISTLFIITTCIGLGSAGFGKCPEKSDLSVTVWPSFIGQWHEYASYGDGTTRTFYKCMRYTFSSTEGSVDAVRDYKFKTFNTLGSSPYSIEPDGLYDFIMHGMSYTTSDITMWHVATDYENYSILWSCSNHMSGLYHTESSWILTRNRTESLNKDIEEKIGQVLRDHSMDRSWYGPVTQSGCD